MAAKPVVDGIQKQLGEKRLRVLRIDVSSQQGRKVAGMVGIDLVPTLVGYDGSGEERWRIEGVPKRAELWGKVIGL